MRLIRCAILTIGFLFFGNSTAQGLIFDEESYLQHPEVPETRSQIKSSVDFSRYVPINYPQWGGTCVAHAFSKARGTLKNKSLYETDKVKKIANSYSPYYIYYTLTDNNDYKCQRGLNIEKAALFVLNFGCAPISQVEYPNYYPFKLRFLGNPYPNSYPTSYKVDAITAKRNAFEGVFRCRNLNQIRASLSDGMVVVVGMKIPKSMKKMTGDFYKMGKYDQGEYGHAMLVVGYSDYKYGGAFKIANSWGEKWGDNGFFWVDYKSFYRMLVAAYACTDKKRYRAELDDNPIDESALIALRANVKEAGDADFEELKEFKELPLSDEEIESLDAEKVKDN